METHKVCPLCASSNLSDLFIVNDFHINKCKDCSLVFVNEKPTNEYLAEFYASETAVLSEDEKQKHVYLSDRNKQNLKYAYSSLEKRIRKIFAGKTDLKILDIGCSAGGFLDLFPDWDTYGVEIEKEAAKIAQVNHKIYIGNMEEAKYEDSFFNCITIQDALDHSNNPVKVIECCYKYLKKDGIIAIKVHNIDCLLAKITKQNFYAIIPPAHLTYFNLPTLRMLLDKNGFKYKGHYFNTQKLRLDTAFMRASQTFKGLWFKNICDIISKSFIGNIPIYKNFNDIITVIGEKH